MAANSTVEPFAVKDCTLAAIATGRHAQNLRELRDHLQVVHPGSIYNHFWGGLLHPQFDDPEYNNDFASWARHALHDAKLAERLGVIDPANFSDMETLRLELLDTIEERLDETEYLQWARHDQRFHFIRSQIVVFDTGRRIRHPCELAEIVSKLSLGSIFYHVIDARRREPQRLDDFRAWLGRFAGKYTELCNGLSGIDPYFITLAELRERLTATFAAYALPGDGT